MEHQLFKAIVAVVCSLDNVATLPRFDFSDRDIVLVYYWSVICDRPTSWACQRRNWPLHLRKRPLPSPATMSRRLRSPSVVALLDQLERRVIAPKEPGLYWMLDGKPLPVGGCSKDRQAGYGKAAGGKAKGYKLHALMGSDGSIAQWRVAPMNKDERVMAERMLKSAPPWVHGYIVADANYDSNPLHRLCDQRGNLQLVTPRRYGPHKGTGHRRQTAGRLRSIAITENPYPAFGQRLLQDRAAIERHYGNLTNWGGGLSGLPAWVRTHGRVRRWVQAKLVLAALKRQEPIRTCAA
jgi:Transposase DDE domain